MVPGLINGKDIDRFMLLAFEVCWSRGPDGISCYDDPRNILEGIRSLVSTLAVDISAIARTIAIEERVMVNPQVSLLDLIVEAGIPGDAMRALVGGNTIVYVPRQDGFLVDMVNQSIEEDSNTTCNEDSNTTCDEDSNTTYNEDSNITCEDNSNKTCDDDSNRTCDEDSNITCGEDSNTTCEED